MTDVNYSDKIDRDFVFELTKIGKVHLCSSQVTVEGVSLNMKKVTIPKGVTIDWIGGTESGRGTTPAAMITFSFPD